jgi:hypothetical protein
MFKKLITDQAVEEVIAGMIIVRLIFIVAKVG